MKKLHLILGFLSIILFSSCNDKHDNDAHLNSGPDKQIIKMEKIGSNIIMNNTTDQISSLREGISYDNIQLLISGEKVDGELNQLAKVGEQFIGGISELKTQHNITKNVNGGIPKEIFDAEMQKYDSELVREFDVELSIYDHSTKEAIDSGKVYINGVHIGDFSQGKYNGKFSWLKGVEHFNILIRSEQYGDATINLNSINSEGNILFSDIFMQKALLKNITLGKKQTIETGKLTIDIGECSIIDKKGSCIKDDVILKTSFITGKKANKRQVSLDMSAITKEGKLIGLQSGGMAFIEFINTNGEILQLKDDQTLDIKYDITETDIYNLTSMSAGKNLRAGYWWYDKNNGIWRESSAEYAIDKDTNTFSATIANLY